MLIERLSNKCVILCHVDICRSTSLYFLGNYESLNFRLCDLKVPCLEETRCRKLRMETGIQRRNRFVSGDLGKVKQREIRHRGIAAWGEEWGKKGYNGRVHMKSRGRGLSLSRAPGQWLRDAPRWSHSRGPKLSAPLPAIRSLCQE